jgi:hypothetical protein
LPVSGRDTALEGGRRKTAEGRPEGGFESAPPCGC